MEYRFYISWILLLCYDLTLICIAKSQSSKPECSVDRCPPTQPFRCPGIKKVCISIQFLCDGTSDCPDGYDEDTRLCTATKRVPVQDTADFLQTLLDNHGPDYLEKLFGIKARNALEGLGGVQKVALALSESETLEDFGKALDLTKRELQHLRSVIVVIEAEDMELLKFLDFEYFEWKDITFLVHNLVSTGFVD